MTKTDAPGAAKAAAEAREKKQNGSPVDMASPPPITFVALAASFATKAGRRAKDGGELAPSLADGREKTERAAFGACPPKKGSTPA